MSSKEPETWETVTHFFFKNCPCGARKTEY